MNSAIYQYEQQVIIINHDLSGLTAKVVTTNRETRMVRIVVDDTRTGTQFPLWIAENNLEARPAKTFTYDVPEAQNGRTYTTTSSLVDWD